MSTNEQTDKELVKATQAGDKQAFGLLVDRHLPMTRRVAMRIIANQEVAWELAQEAMLQAYLSLNNLRDGDRFASWLYGIVRNVCHDYLRSQKTVTFSLDALAGGAQVEDARLFRWEPDPQQIVEASELRQRLSAAIESLSAKNKAATQLFYDENLSLQEIALRLGTSVNVIKNRLFQSRKQLQTQLADVYKPLTNTPHFMNSTQQRKRMMIKISALHAIETALTGSYILYLLDTAGGRALPIWVGPYEGSQISQLLHSEAAPRPMTHRFMASLLDKLGAKLQEVRVEALKENTFYAVVKAQNGKTVQEVDARPSDALALALQMKTPIFVADAVMEKVGQPLPQPFDEQAWLRQETQHMAEMTRTAQAWVEKLKEAPSADTPNVVRILKQAQTLAQAFNHHYIGTEHLLLSLVSEQESNPAKLLQAAGASQQGVTETLARLVGRGQTPSPAEPVIVPRAVQVLELAEEERRTLGQPQIEADHILLGLIDEGHGMAMTILHELGVEPDQVQAKIRAAIKSTM